MHFGKSDPPPKNGTWAKSREIQGQIQFFLLRIMVDTVVHLLIHLVGCQNFMSTLVLAFLQSTALGFIGITMIASIVHLPLLSR